MNFQAPKSLRITQRGDFSRLFEKGTRIADGELTLILLPNDRPDAASRLGVAVAKRHGNSVQRNRIKRLCREAFRLMRPELPPGWDVMLIPRVGRSFTLEGLQRSIGKLIERGIRKHADREDRG
jgi:ribonuclease P protein component